MTRREELTSIIKASGKQNDIKARQLIDEVIYLEEKMDYLRGLPFIKVDENNPWKQKPTPASKMYKEMLQQYNNCLRLLFRLAGELGESEETSPLRIWAEARKAKDADHN